MRNLSIALLAVAWTAHGQQSQPPSPTPAKTAQNDQGKPSAKQTKSGEDQRISDALSAAINKLASEIAAREKQRDTAPEKTDSSSEWWLKWSTIVSAVAAFFIAVLAYRQWRTLQAHHTVMKRQAGYIRRALNQAKIAAEAAKRSTDALINSERAWVLVSNPRSSTFWIDEPPPSIIFQFDIANRGKTVAKLMDFRAEVRYVGLTDRLPDAPPDYEAFLRPDEPIHGRILAPGESMPDMLFPLNELHGTLVRNDVMAGRVLVYLYAFIKYYDFANEERRLRFCYQFVPEIHRWVQSGPPLYNSHT